MKRMLRDTPDTVYSVTVDFCGFVGSEVELFIDARTDADREELLYIVQEDYADDLLAGEVVEVDEDTYEVEVTFDGQIGTSETYSVWANNEDEAIEDALEEAKADIDIVEFHEM